MSCVNKKSESLSCDKSEDFNALKKDFEQLQEQYLDLENKFKEVLESLVVKSKKKDEEIVEINTNDALIEDIRSELEKEIRTRVQKGTLAETVPVKKGRETYIVSWLENYVNKQLFKKLLKKVGAIKGTYPNTIIPTAYIDFLQDPYIFHSSQ